MSTTNLRVKKPKPPIFRFDYYAMHTSDTICCGMYVVDISHKERCSTKKTEDLKEALNARWLSDLLDGDTNWGKESDGSLFFVANIISPDNGDLRDAQRSDQKGKIEQLELLGFKKVEEYTNTNTGNHLLVYIKTVSKDELEKGTY